jgi:putative radical SAM enzyme (TIGR03279 family)
MHAQIVLCPGLNDGEQLTRTIEDLAARQEVVLSAAAVPVGLTRYCRNPEMRLFGAEEARAVVQQVTPLQKHYRATLGRSFVQLSDEFYVMSGLPVPPSSWYDGFPQLDNGVGLVRRLLSSWASSRRRLPVELPGPRRVGWICGTSAYPTLLQLAADMNRVQGLEVDLYPVQNHFFGTTVTVSGLLTGADVLETMGHKRVDGWVLPRVMFDDEGERTLDGVTLEELRRQTPHPVSLAGSASELMRLSLRGE